MKSEQKKSFWCSALQGSMVGTGATLFASPFLGWSNLVIKAKEHSQNPNIWKLLFDKRVLNGTSTYITAIAPVTATTLTCQNQIMQYLPNNNLGMITSKLSAGFISGVLCSPFEAIAQNATFNSKMSKWEIVNQIYKNNGITGFGRGTLVLGVRESLWAISYLAAPTYLGCFYESLGMKKKYGQTMAAFTAGGIFGVVSCPLNLLRFHKQNALTQFQENKSYINHCQKLWNQSPRSNIKSKLRFFFNGGLPRAVAASTASTLLHVGMESTDNLFTPGNKR
tara:strand:- start:52 stop:891 length:840 start_codon:yes stop_codon:yes gene_type:complete